MTRGLLLLLLLCLGGPIWDWGAHLRGGHLMLGLATVQAAIYMDPCADGHNFQDMAMTKAEHKKFSEALATLKKSSNPTGGKDTGRRSVRVSPAEEEEKGDSLGKRAAISGVRMLWDDAVIPYHVDPDAGYRSPTKKLLLRAMRHWEQHTCLTFPERELDTISFVRFQKGSCGCRSFVGDKGNGAGQGVNIGRGCEVFNTILHELGHAIGYFHEQSRPDRDQHVQIYFNNIVTGQEFNFRVETGVDSLNESYDYLSIMHYGSDFWAKNGSMLTMEPINYEGSQPPPIGYATQLSEGDIRQTNKLYRCPQCGRTMQEPEDSFGHQPTPGESHTCQWRITASPGNRVVLSILDLDLPQSPNCSTDYLEVRDGHYHKSPLLGRFCGNSVPDILSSTGYRLWIEYKSSSGQGAGFSAKYEAVCGGELRMDHGFVSNPGFPDKYGPNQRCVWKIIVSPGYRVHLNFDIFELAYEKNCQDDHMEVRDGGERASQKLGRYCGSTVPEITSTGNQLYLEFVSDYQGQHEGFLAEFRAVDIDECSVENGGCQDMCSNTEGSYYCSCYNGLALHTDRHHCQEDTRHYQISDPNAVLVTPGWPHFYPHNTECSWVLTTAPGHRISLALQYFHLQQSDMCQKDRLEILDGPQGSQSMGSFCGYSFFDSIDSSDNTMTLLFHSDQAGWAAGFQAVYYPLCGGVFKAEATPRLIYSHPEYGHSNYEKNTVCHWILHAEENERVQVTFTDFDVEFSDLGGCGLDSLMFYDGNTQTSPELGKFCGNTNPGVITSTGRNLFVSFYSDYAVTNTGFNLSYLALPP